MPRPDKKFMAINEARPRTPWTLPVSLFKEYKPEHSVLVNDCFEFDWQCLKKPKFKTCTEEEMKEQLRSLYPFLREVYKHLSGLGMVGTVFSIGWNTFTEFVNTSLNVIDKEKFNLADCDRLFISVNSSKRAALIPANALCRFKFLEIIMRMAIKRYYETGEAQSELEAIDIMKSK